MLITPEGTRKQAFIILPLLLPIALGYCDYAKKEVGVAKLVYPSGDIKKDMKEIMAFYKDITPHTPQNFSVDVDYDA